ncbi:unnamed protein product [Parnassius apollo]|uniref:(apollo) hypothetical protein n=1 Tax=Parnassius apollo TaxID=110799 RepID=A0A8S3WFX8_PARAO|nr:unnamed protein product [Parnassius apollo]
MEENFSRMAAIAIYKNDCNDIEGNEDKKVQKNEIGTQTKLSTRKVRFMDWKKYHKLNIIYDFLDELERDFPAICTVSVIGKSVEGRSIKMLKISNSDASNSPVWLDASIHPREWITTAVITYIANTLARNFHNLSESVTNKDCCGWGSNGDQGSSDEPNNVFYRGPIPFSEPETVAVRDTIMSSSTPFKVFLSFHSYFELIIFPWGHKTDACPDYLNLLEGGTIMARAIYETSGITYKVGSTKDLTYYACGTSTDWSYTMANIPYSYMIELRSRKHKFRLPKDQIIETGKEIWNAVKKLMDFVDEQR